MPGRPVSRARTAVAMATLATLAGLTAPPPEATAQALRYSLSGNMRTQIGAGFPFPITLQPAPDGAIPMPSRAVAFQTTGPDPKAMTLSFRATGPLVPFRTGALGVNPLNSVVFQFHTSAAVFAPSTSVSPARFSAGGRTGPAVLTWCPGQPLPTASFDPACTNIASATAVHGAAVNAGLRYQATSNQFGGTSRIRLTGSVGLVLVAVSPPPCRAIALGGSAPSCFGIFHQTPVLPTAPLGGAFGVVGAVTPTTPPGNLRWIGATTSGLVTSVGGTPLGTVSANALVSWGGPWTTGKVTVRAPAAVGGLQTFYLQGSDGRVSGIGSISMVAGSVALRSISGPLVNRGWLNLVLSPFAVPSVSGAGLALLATTFAAAALWLVGRAR